MASTILVIVLSLVGGLLFYFSFKFIMEGVREFEKNQGKKKDPLKKIKTY